MPKACCSVTNWNKAKHKFLTLSKWVPLNSNKPYISPKTEAYAILVCKGNAMRWKKQFEIAKDPKCRGKIPSERPINPKLPHLGRLALCI